jgi:outer membrane protein assembly factor BamA
MRLGLTIVAVVLGLVLLVVLSPGAAVAQPQAVIPIPHTAPREAGPQVPALAPPPDLQGLVGRPVTRVAVVLEGNIWDDVQVPDVKRLRPGDPMTAAAARDVLEELLGSGRFARGRVLAEAEGAGVLVVARLVPRKLVGKLTIDLHGAPLERDEVLREADLSDGGEIVGADVEAAADRIERYAALHGYPSAHADIQTRDTDDPMRALVLVDVAPGRPRAVDARYFYAFGATLDELKPVTDAYAIHPGDRADEPAMDQADAALEQALRAKGWHRADVSHDLAWVGPQGARTGRVVLRVRIDAGPRVVARFEGNAHYDDDALTAALGLDSETDRSPSHLADKIRSFYEKRAFLDVDVRVEARGAEGDRVQVLVLHIDEHPRVRVVERRYPCLKLDAVKHLSGGGPRSAGDIGREIDSFLEEELPGADLFVDPDPQGLSVMLGDGGVPPGSRPVPLDLHPDATYVADTYERAATHVQELYRNEGFLHAEVGPVQVVRARCDPRSPPRACVPLALPPLPQDMCAYDPSGLPVATPPLDASTFACRPDPARGVACAPQMQLIIPVRLGPRTRLWDEAFTGVKSVSERAVADAAQVPLGEPVSTTKLEDARRRVVDWYKELGYYYVDVKYALEPSADNTRARVRFDVTEGDQVIVRAIQIRGLRDTSESVVRRRIALEVGQPYRTSDVRKTQERLATLGVFSSITVGLSEPYFPQPSKIVVIDVTERVPQYVEIRPGFSTGEGMRGTLEYAHRNLLGYAWSMQVHLQASYLPDFLILDPQYYQNYANNPDVSAADRIATRDTVTFAWPEMGLGPTVRSQTDFIYVRDLERDFTLLKGAVLGTAIWRPVRELQISAGPSFERNDVHLFCDLPPAPSSSGGATMSSGSTKNCDLASYVVNVANGNPALQTLLRVPDGDSYVVAGRLVLTWDRRDSAFNAHKGTYVVLSGEQVNSYPVANTASPDLQFQSHFVRLAQTLAGYIPITSSVALAAEVRVGEIVNVTSCMTAPGSTLSTPPPYCTYPDRMFFMGGFDSMRGWLQDSFIPQDIADQIAKGNINCQDQSNCKVPLRGGNLMVNPRFELRFPIRLPIEGAVFADFGNVWSDPSTLNNSSLKLRSDIGAGVRVDTPVGPLVFDYGINVSRQSYEDFGAFHFAIGLF